MAYSKTVASPPSPPQLKPNQPELTFWSAVRQVASKAEWQPTEAADLANGLASYMGKSLQYRLDLVLQPVRDIIKESSSGTPFSEMSYRRRLQKLEPLMLAGMGAAAVHVVSKSLEGPSQPAPVAQAVTMAVAAAFLYRTAAEPLWDYGMKVAQEQGNHGLTSERINEILLDTFLKDGHCPTAENLHYDMANKPEARDTVARLCSHPKFNMQLFQAAANAHPNLVREIHHSLIERRIEPEITVAYQAMLDRNKKSVQLHTDIKELLKPKSPAASWDI